MVEVETRRNPKETAQQSQLTVLQESLKETVQQSKLPIIQESEHGRSGDAENPQVECAAGSVFPREDQLRHTVKVVKPAITREDHAKYQ